MAKMKELYTMIQSGEYIDFKKAYEIAKADKVDTFTYGGEKVSISDAKYKVEFVELFLKNLTNDNIYNSQFESKYNL